MIKSYCKFSDNDKKAIRENIEKINNSFEYTGYSRNKCIDKLMKVCDELEIRIKESKKYNEKLMESILKDSFKA